LAGVCIASSGEPNDNCQEVFDQRFHIITDLHGARCIDHPFINQSAALITSLSTMSEIISLSQYPIGRPCAESRDHNRSILEAVKEYPAAEISSSFR
jgi:hypothetical protein